MPISTPSPRTDLALFPGWCSDSDLLPAVRSLFRFGDEDRATGYLPDVLYCELIGRLEAELGIRFTVVAFQAYRNGSGCDWHADTPFDAQAILSLGATRTFGVRPNGGQPEWLAVSHGDLVFMPPGFQDKYEHCVPVEDEPGERVSLVFRTVRS